MTDDTDLLAGLEALEGKLAQARASITRRFIGQERVVGRDIGHGHGLAHQPGAVHTRPDAR